MLLVIQLKKQLHSLEVWYVICRKWCIFQLDAVHWMSEFGTVWMASQLWILDNENL